MGSHYGNLILLILEKHFDSNVKKVAERILHGPKPLKLIVHDLDIKLVQVKECLHLLIKHSLATFKSSKNGMVAEYKLNHENVLKMLRYSKYLELMQKKYGPIGKALVEDMIINGYTDLSHLILRVVKNGTLDSPSVHHVHDKLKKIVTAGYVIRYCDSSLLSEEQHVPNIEIDTELLTVMPNIDFDHLSECLKLKDNYLVVDNVLFTLSLKRFDQDYRDEIILDTVERRYNEEARIVMGEILREQEDISYWNSTSHSILISTIKDKVFYKYRKDHNTEQYIKVLEDPTCGWLQTATDIKSAVVIQFGYIINKLATTLIENLVENKFGCKAARIFRIIKSKKYIEQNQIQRLAMIPDKEAKTLTYNLLQENFVMIKELRKPGASQAGPNKTFFLFHIKMKLVVEVVLKYCYQAIYNANIRIAHEKFEKQSLVDKYFHIENLRRSVIEQQNGNEEMLEALNQLMCPREKEELTNVNKTINVLETTILQVNEMLFVLELYKYYMNLSLS